MFSFLKQSSVVQNATKSWRLLFNQTFCCHLKPNTLLSPKRNLSYSTFNSRIDEDASDEVLSSYGDHDNGTEELNKPQTQECLTSLDHDHISHSPDNNAIISQPTHTLLSPTSTVERAPSPPLLSPLNCPDVFPKTNFSPDTIKSTLSPGSECSSSGVSSGILTQPSSMEFSDTLSGDKLSEAEDTDIVDKDNKAKISIDIKETVDDVQAKEAQVAELSSEPFLDTGDAVCSSPEEQEEQETAPPTTTNDELLVAIEKCKTSMDVLEAVTNHQGFISPLLGVACIHYIYMKALGEHERNSPSYNKLCGQIHTNPTFREMIFTVEANAKTLNNFALLTVASDLLYLRITLKKSTIPNILSCVDCEALNLEELRLLASCLHTPSIPMVNSEYMYNVAGGVAMKYLDDITDLYTLLSIIKCFGRYFTTQAKRQADIKVASFIEDLAGTYPDGRLMASHMFDAFYRMEYAPSRPLQLEACKAINASTVPLAPQDVSAILRYFVKYGYNLTDDGLKMLNKISDVLYRHLETEPVTKFTTNVKWLSVFYYYNEALLERYINAVKRDMDKLDFVALSDVLDTLAQIYYLPDDADAFFDQLHSEMMTKYPTLHRSNVKNVQRKLLLTAFHFSVFGRYPYPLIKLTLSPEQVQLNHGLSKHFMREFCESLRIERPDLLPPTIPQHNRDMSFTSPKLYAFEKDVRVVLNHVVGPRKFTNVSSPVRGLPMFILRQQLDGSILSIRRNTPAFIPPHVHQTVQNVAVIPLPRSRYCVSSKHAVGKTRHALRLIRAQGARVVTVPHFEWDGHSFEHKAAMLSRKIFEQRTDDVTE